MSTIAAIGKKRWLLFRGTKENWVMAHVTVDGRIYDLDKLSESARQQAMNIEIVDQEIRRLQVQLMIYQTARNAYATALQQALPKE
jgi:hypothetical protein